MRSKEPSWLEAMKRSLDELRELQQELEVPIFCAGDIFDCWYGAYKSSELINFALTNLPKMVAIPGQHDLPHHNSSLLSKSAIYTLAHNKSIDLFLEDVYSYKKEGFVIQVSLISFDKPLFSAPKSKADIRICVHHRYVCTNTDRYPTADKQYYVSHLPKEVTTYDIAVFGDNHKGFVSQLENTLIWNCGTFFIRKADELKYRPRLGILTASSHMIPYYLDTSKDIYLESSALDNYLEKNMRDFVQSLQIEQSSLDFVEAIKQYIQNTPSLDEETKKVLIQISELK